MSVADGVGVFLVDEVWSSSDPAKHADDLVATMQRHRLHWVCQQLDDPRGQESLRLLSDATERRGWGAAGGWSHNANPTEAIERAFIAGATFYIANVESQADDARWQTAHLDRLKANMPDGCAVIFTEGAWGRDQALSKRWRDRGFAAIPEADMPANPQATIPAMLELAAALGWTGDQTSVAVYLTGGTLAATYTPHIALTQGRWCVYRYGNIGPDGGQNWQELDQWPRPAPVPPPPPPPPLPPLPTMTVMEAHANTRYGVQAVRNKGTVLGRAASLTLQDRLALAAITGGHDAEKGLVLANMLDQLGYPQV